MLTSLHVENLALIKKADIPFDGGLCVLTGETGAGKSLLIDSLSLLCGGRGDRELIRTGEEYCLAEGVFCDISTAVQRQLDEVGFAPDEDGLMVLSRRIALDGRSTCRVNGRQVPASRLREVASLLLGIHGQQETLTLSDPAKQLSIIDSRSGSEQLLAAYKEVYARASELKKRINALTAAEDEKAYRLDMLNYRIAELEAFAPQNGEEERLTEQKTLIMSGEKIRRGSSEAHDFLDGKGGSVAARAQGAINALNPLKDIISEVPSLIERLYNIRYEAEDIADTLSKYADDDMDDGAALDAVQERLLNYNALKRKCRVQSGDELVTLLADLKNERESIENSEEELKQLQKQLKAVDAQLAAAARSLTECRRAGADGLISETREILAFLDMPSVRFEIGFTPVQPTPDGCDAVCFMLSANKGEELRPMGRIASGGELSRIMLALKKAAARADGIATVVFDEIDTGISGATSDKIGMLLAETAHAGGCQVICVTHSALIAAKADHHLLISKSETDGRTSTCVKRLNTDGRRAELARILGGVSASETAFAAADELLRSAKII